MRIKRTSFLISMIAILLALLAWIVPTSETAHATTAVDPQPRSITVSGLGPNDAILKDQNGHAIPSDDPYYYWSHYNVNYNWSIPDGVPIKAGDTATFELPSNVRLTANLTNVPLLDKDGVQIGTYSIKAGETTGTITFNDVLSSTTIDRNGTLYFHVRGNNTNTGEPGQLDWNINKVGWLSGTNEDGLPEYITWNIAFNPRSEHLTNVVITDKLSEGQTYVESSVYAPTGSYNQNNNFISDGGVLTPTVVQNGNEIKFNFGDVNTAVDMTFKVRIKVDPTKDNIYTDNASLTSDQITGNVSSSVHYGGSGSGNGSNATGNIVLHKTDQDGKPLAGAVYELKDSTGKVLMSEVPVDENGELKVFDLPAGTYTLTEIKAPDGYDLNSTPIEFTIPGTIKGETLNLDQVDNPSTEPPVEEPDTGSVIFDKVSVTTGDLLPGAEYDLLDANGKVVQSGLVTDDQGRISISGLEVGDYAFKETKAPDGYDLSTELIPFSITKDKSTYITASDVLTSHEEDYGGAILSKTDENGKPLAGATYELKDSNGDVIDKYSTDKDGKIKFDALADGKYTLTEIEAPDGYDVNKTPIEFTVEKGKITELSAKDEKSPSVVLPPVVEPETGTVTLTKTDEAGKLLAGATYELKDSKGTIIGDKHTTDSNGKITIENLADGKYTLTEIKAPEGYDVNKTPIEFTIENGKVTTLSAKDEKKPSEPGITEPGKPGPGEPSEPGVTEPGKPGPGEPSEPGVTEPEKPGTGEPSEPGVTEPEKPGTGEPSEPGVTEPGKPGPSEPSNPGIVNPVLPTIPGGNGGGSSSGGSSTSTNPGNPSTGSPSGTGRFPQTGNQQNILIAVIGFIILIGLAGFEIKRRRA
ncbi:SpaA isopeptide-forming pilin-related protein [Companilactobacillus hulinensis]|uniref:SpaA isopeptide-forming pilin-related protein n=1 Tax=Companilactobacillus hulinensis TaxID=2486007 RepID=UPI0013DE08D7|nr:SpaA isopeptide-forming pilin-related protein [Companilactobacillus hulinensis]